MTAGPADDLVRAGTPTWQQCRELAAALRHTERAARVRASLRPRGMSGLWRARAPVAVQLWVAGTQGRLVRPRRTSPSFAVIEAPWNRRRAFSSDRRTRWIAALDRAWDHLVFGGVPVVLMGCAVIVLGLRPHHPTHRLAALLLATCALAWVAFGLLAWLARELVDGVRSSRADPMAAASASAVATSWTVVVFHAATDAEATLLLQESLDRIEALWGALPPRGDDLRPSRRVVLLDGITTDLAEPIVLAHPEALMHRPHWRPPIVMIGSADLDARPPRQLVGAEGIGLLLFAVVTVLLVLAQLVSNEEAAAARLAGTPGGLTSYGTALMWLVERLLWLGQDDDPVPLLARTQVWGWLLRILGLVVLAAVVTAVLLTIRKNKAVQEAFEDDLSRAELALRPTLAIVTALTEEFAAVQALLEDARPGRVAGDGLQYLLGRLPSADPARAHPVVVVRQVDAGNSVAAAVTTQLVRSYPTVNHVLMCGIACGVPRPEDPARHVRLGDIVAATWGVVAYDHVDDLPEGARLRDPQHAPSPLLVAAAQTLEVEQTRGRRPWQPVIEDAVARLLRDGGDRAAQFARPPEETDVIRREDGTTVPHPPRAAGDHEGGVSTAHLGRIGAADRSLRNAASRQALADRYSLLAFEMEAFGVATAALAHGVGWLAVRGISDYGDSGTDGRWRHHAALVAAAYTRCLLAQISPLRPRGGQPLGDAVR